LGVKDRKRIKLYKRNLGNKGSNGRWIAIITIWTLLTSGLIGYASDALIGRINIFFAFVFLIIIIFIGILFDIIGVAATAADETPFHSMSSRKVKGGKTAVYFIRNANKVSSLCSDVVGDVCGVVSGGIGTIIIQKVITLSGFHNKIVLTVVICSIIASLTVGGKAVGKSVAINQSNNIVYSVAWFIESIKGK
jgi:CBS domain containing-hemolysin-like protein